ncbi:hypothetical protein Ga0061065_10317 [Marinomonas fungiae]|uniref:DUF1353 domain-containing protein n=1 Tax=Marinomonas fungiae TaxID=1137284 RepID=A0A0K6IJ98_9GAMM|nr:hypothetical protein Ga0061065_10317 [Marinomonas fungiae]
MLNLYVLEQDFELEHPKLEGISFHNEWCSLSNGKLTIKKGYSHDGCSPKFSVLGLIVIGVPDGHLINNKPITYNASLVHDCFCQFRDVIPITKSIVVEIFSDMLKEAKFALRKIYVKAVDLYGPQEFYGDRIAHG